MIHDADDHHADGEPRTVVVPASESLEATLRTFGRVAGFPDYYGSNLDALLDCLRDQPSLRVRLEDADRLHHADPDGYHRLVEVLRQARSESDDFHFTIGH